MGPPHRSFGSVPGPRVAGLVSKTTMRPMVESLLKLVLLWTVGYPLVASLFSVILATWWSKRGTHEAEGVIKFWLGSLLKAAHTKEG